MLKIWLSDKVNLRKKDKINEKALKLGLFHLLKRYFSEYLPGRGGENRTPEAGFGDQNFTAKLRPY